MRDICDKIATHFLKPHFLSYVSQNSYCTTHRSIRTEPGHMYRPNSFFDVNIHTLIFLLIKNTIVHR
ncbi:hypothetical protein D3C73_1533320 [compost metagenome]